MQQWKDEICTTHRQASAAAGKHLTAALRTCASFIYTVNAWQKLKQMPLFLWNVENPARTHFWCRLEEYFQHKLLVSCTLCQRRLPYLHTYNYLYLLWKLKCCSFQILNWQAGYQQAHHSSLVDILGLRKFWFNLLNIQIETVIHLRRAKSTTLSQ